MKLRTRNLSWQSWAALAAGLLLSACHGHLPWTKTAEPVRTQATPTVTVEIDVETLAVKVVQPEGARVCSLCTEQLREKYGPACEKAPEAGIPICAGLVDASVQDIRFITLARSRKNPDCFTIGSQNIGGTDISTQLCLCQPTDPPGACPAPAWFQ